MSEWTKEHNEWMTGAGVICLTCQRHKAPRGRSVPMEIANGMCDHECAGYAQHPVPGDLWPGEKREEFGYPKECPLCSVPIARAVAALEACAGMSDPAREIAELKEKAKRYDDGLSAKRVDPLLDALARDVARSGDKRGERT